MLKMVSIRFHDRFLVSSTPASQRMQLRMMSSRYWYTDSSVVEYVLSKRH